MNPINIIFIKRYFKKNNIFFLALVVNALFLITNMYIRPLVPVDEERYISVAWEMNTNSSFLVPLLNQEPYSHKPAFLFWLINVFWSMFAKTEVVARLAIAIFSIGNLFAVRFLANLIYPQNPQCQSWAPLVLTGFFLWNIYCSTLMFDCLLSFFLLLYITFMLFFSRGSGFGYVWLAGFFCGLSLLTKGPVALIYSLPVLLLYPVWQDISLHKLSCTEWYQGIFTSLIIAFFLLLLWVLPAAILGGRLYANQLLWVQTVDRLSGVLAHMRPWYWYLPFIPLSIFPLSMSKNFWRIFLNKGVEKSDLFCILWIITPIVLFSIIKSKQLHYLVPILPAAAIFIASKKAHLHQSKGILIVLYLVFSICCFIFPLIINVNLKSPALFSSSQFFAGVPLFFSVAIFYWCKSSESISKMMLLGMPIFFLALLGATKPILDSHYQVKLAAQKVSALQNQHQQVVVWGRYHGEYHFLGRLTGKLTVVHNVEWLKENPGAIVLYSGHKNDLDLIKRSIASYRSGGHQIYFIYAASLRPILRENNVPSDSLCKLGGSRHTDGKI